MPESVATRKTKGGWLRAVIVVLVLFGLILGVLVVVLLNRADVGVALKVYRQLREDPPQLSKSLVYTEAQGKAVEHRIWSHGNAWAKGPANADPGPLVLNEKEINIYVKHRLQEERYKLDWIDDIYIHLKGDTLRVEARLNLRSELMPPALNDWIREHLPASVEEKLQKKPWLKVDLTARPEFTRDGARFNFSQGRIGSEDLDRDEVSLLGERVLADLVDGQGPVGGGLGCLTDARVENGRFICRKMDRKKLRKWLKKYGVSDPRSARPHRRPGGLPPPKPGGGKDGGDPDVF